MTKTKQVVWMAWVIGSIFYAYQYILRVMPSIMMGDILTQFNINANTYGQFSGVYYIGYALMHLPLGILIHKFGPKKILPMCILITVLGITPIIFAEHWIYPIIGRALVGIGSSAAILGLFQIIRFTFKESQFTKMLSYSVIIGLIGAIYGGAPVNYMCSEMGYKNVVVFFSVVGIVLAFAAYYLIPNNTEATKDSSITGDILEVIRNSKVMFFCILAGLMVGANEGFADVWGTAYLQTVYNLDKTTASTLPSLIFLGMGFGAPTLSFITEKTKSHMLVIILSALIMMVCFLLFLSTQMSVYMLCPIFFIIGVCCAYQIIAIYKSSTYVKPHVAGLTTSFANMTIMIFGYFFHSIIGYTVNALGGKDNPFALKIGIVIIPISLGIAALGYTSIAFLDKQKKLVS